MKLRPAPTTTIAAATATSLALIPFRDVFQGSGWAYRIILGIIAAAVIASTLETIRWRPSIPAIASITAAGAILWSVVVMTESFRRGPVSTQPWRDIRAGLFDGWSALLDDQVPLRDAPSAAIFVAIFAWIITALAIHVAARRNTALAAIIGAAVMLGLAVAAALPAGLTSTLVGSVVGAGALTMIATTTRVSDGRWRSGRFVSLAFVIGTAALFAAGFGQLAARGGAEPLDPRTSRNISLVEREVPDILADFTSLLGDSTVLTVESITSEQLPEIRLRLQVYDVYNGERWQPAAEFREVASFPQPRTLPPGELVQFRVRVAALDGPWIPLPDRLVATDLTDIRWSESTQTALATDPLRSYTVTGTLTLVDRSGLDGLETARDEVATEYTRLPAGLPDSIRTAAQQVAGAAPDGVAAAEALATFIREIGRNDSVAPGHSLARLRDDLDRLQPTGAEQLASLHALMARSLGYPARIVVGYMSSERTVTADQLYVWTELAFPTVGWVAFDPVPRRNEGPSDVGLDSVVTTTTLAEATAVQAQALPRQLEPDVSTPGDSSGRSQDRPWNDAGNILIALVVVSLLSVMSARVIRRRARRSHTDIQTRILGAWAEFVDRMREAGAPIARTTTVNDVVYMAREMDAALGDEAEALGAITSLALHGPQHGTPEQAKDAWEILRRSEHALVSVRGRKATIARILDPRVLRYRAPLAPRAPRPSGLTEQADRSR